MPASFGPRRPETAGERGRTKTQWNIAIAFPSVLFLEELSPESQKTRLAILIAHGAPISRWPGFFHAAVCRSLSRYAIGLTSDSQQSKPIFDEDPRKKSRAGRWHKTSKKAAAFFVRSGYPLAGASIQQGLALRLYKPRPLPRGTGIPFVPQRMQQPAIAPDPGGTWLSRLCGTAQEEGTVRVG